MTDNDGRQLVALNKLGEIRAKDQVLYQAIQEVQQKVNAVILAEGGITDEQIAAAIAAATPPGGFGDALTANPLSQFAATTSAQLAGVLSDETGSGPAVFGTAPTITLLVVTFTDITTGNVTSTMHGLAPKSPADATKFLDGGATPAFNYVTADGGSA